MGLLSSVNNSGFKRKNVSEIAFLAGANITSLKEDLTDLISSKPKGFINEMNWGSIGSFYFTTYRLPRNMRFSDSDEYMEYTTMAKFKERVYLRENNRNFSLSFTMKQRDTKSDTQKEENLFEADILRTLDALYAEKKKHIPLDLFLYSGQIYLGQYSIDSIEVNIVELDSGGYPDTLDIGLELTKFPRSQETGVSLINSGSYLRLANI